MKVKDYFTFFRWKNLLMIVLIQLLIKFVLFQKFHLSASLDNLHFGILVLSTLFIAIGGYIINDLHDVKADLINKPKNVFVGTKITVKQTNRLFVIFNSIGLLLGFYLSNHIDRNSFFVVYLIISLLLYRYSINLKKKLLIGNLIISLIVFLSLFIIVLFDLVPVTNSYNRETQLEVSNIILIYSCFAFVLTLIREIVKDLIDIEGDEEIKCKSIPIVYGTKKTKIVLILLSISTLLSISYIAFLVYNEYNYLSYYLLLLIGLPLLYFIFILNRSSSKEDFKKLSNLLKIIMLIGIISILLI